MKSPFPGMDPYLEAHWPDVHQSLCTSARNALNAQFGPALRARMGERLIVEEDFDAVRSIYPDVRVFERPAPGVAVLPPVQSVALTEPIVVPLESDEVRQPFIQIVDLAADARVVSIIEFISPSNKVGKDGREKYLQKRQEAVKARISFIEIDLTRGGEREPLDAIAGIRRLQDAAYYAFAVRAYGRKQCEVYPISLRDRLPAIRIPLRATDPDAVLELQPLIDQAYVDGRYDDIDYRKPCIPPLQGADAAWAEELLKSAGKR